jgi:hypothetical protein
MGQKSQIFERNVTDGDCGTPGSFHLDCLALLLFLNVGIRLPCRRPQRDRLPFGTSTGVHPAKSDRIWKLSTRDGCSDVHFNLRIQWKTFRLAHRTEIFGADTEVGVFAHPTIPDTISLPFAVWALPIYSTGYNDGSALEQYLAGITSGQSERGWMRSIHNDPVHCFVSRRRLDDCQSMHLAGASVCLRASEPPFHQERPSAPIRHGPYLRCRRQPCGGGRRLGGCGKPIRSRRRLGTAGGIRSYAAVSRTFRSADQAPRRAWWTPVPIGGSGRWYRGLNRPRVASAWRGDPACSGRLARGRSWASS